MTSKNVAEQFFWHRFDDNVTQGIDKISELTIKTTIFYSFIILNVCFNLKPIFLEDIGKIVIR